MNLEQAPTPLLTNRQPQAADQPTLAHAVGEGGPPAERAVGEGERSPGSGTTGRQRTGCGDLSRPAPPAAPDPLYEQAIARLKTLLDDACHRGERECNAAALATADRHARPSVRMINVARVAESGIALFAHAETGKGQQMRQNPRAALCFHWPLLHYEVIVEGEVVLLPEEEADALWQAQPREFGIGHWASDQTAADDQTRQAQAHEFRQRFNAERPPRAPGWRAFEIHPDRIDFWATGWTRLSARVRYRKADDGHWTVSRENP